MVTRGHFCRLPFAVNAMLNLPNGSVKFHETKQFIGLTKKRRNKKKKKKRKKETKKQRKKEKKKIATRAENDFRLLCN